MKGADVVISTLGAAKGSVITDSTRGILAGARRHGVKRVVVLSSFAVQRERLRPLAKFITGMAIGSQIKDKRIAEEKLRASGLDWTIVHASVLTNGPASGATSIVPDDAKRSLSQKISRADVAAWLVDAATGDDRHVRDSVALAARPRRRRGATTRCAVPRA
jgi:uncharacterized protein YbjT (DUF2867 family)